MKYKTSRLAGGFVLFCIEIKLPAKLEGGFPRLWPSKFSRCEFRKWLKTASAGGAYLKLCAMQIRCNGQKRADCKYVFYTENLTARWRFQFRSHRSQTFELKVETIFQRLRRYYFSFKWDFWRRRKCPRRLLHEGGLSGSKQSPQKFWRAFDIWQGCLLRLKNYLRPTFQTQCSFLPRDERL